MPFRRHWPRRYYVYFHKWPDCPWHMPEQDDKALCRSIRATEHSHAAVEGKLETDELVLARITEGIYRQPASALRELVSNAYDADATEVVILTDAPRFGQIT